MRLLWTFALGLLAKALGILALQASTWIMEKVADGQSFHACCLEFRRFWHRLLTSLAAQLSGYRSRSHQHFEYEEEWRPELFGG